MALTGAALIPAASAVPANAATVSAARQVVTATQCIQNGGSVVVDVTSPTFLRCIGGIFNGSPVIRGFNTYGTP